MVGDEGLKLFMANGITAVRDCGARLELVKATSDALRSGEKFGPRLYFCGPLLDGAKSSLPGARRRGDDAERARRASRYRVSSSPSWTPAPTA